MTVSVSTLGHSQLVAFQTVYSGEIFLCPLSDLRDESLVSYAIEGQKENKANLFTNIQFSPDGRFLVVEGCRISRRYEVCLKEITDSVNTYKTIYMEGHTNSIVGAAFSLDGKHLITSSKNRKGELIKWHLEERKKVTTMKDCVSEAAFMVIAAGIPLITYIPNTKYVMTCANQCDIQLRDVDTLEMVKEVADDVNQKLEYATATLDGRHIITTAYEGWIHVRRLPDLAVVARYNMGAVVCGLAVTTKTDGSTIISCGDSSGRNILLTIKL